MLFSYEKNVKEHLRKENLLPKDKWEELKSDLTTIHYSHNPEDYADNLRKIKSLW